MTTATTSRRTKPTPPAAVDSATAYALAVHEARQLTCKWVKLACARHLRDLDDLAHGRSRGYWWDVTAVEDMAEFFGGLRHSKGEWGRAGGQPIVLQPWQIFILGSLFGWKRLDGYRRFQTAYIEVPRKNGKSTIAAGLGLYLAFMDNEPGAEVYAAATKRDQAKVVWDEAKRMVGRSALKRYVRSFVANLTMESTASKFEPLGADADSLDGLNPHGMLVDELHAHRNRAIWDVLETGTGARRQPMLFAITTAGSNLAGVCYEQHLYAQRVLDGAISDDSYFAVIYTIDEGDDWADEQAWAKANPNLGISVMYDAEDKGGGLRAQAARAKEMPSAKVAFLTKRLNVWNSEDITPIPVDQWLKGARTFTLDDVAGLPCWIGVDLASKSDLAAVVAVFVRGEGIDREVWIRSRFYLPSEMVRAEAGNQTAHYAGWAEAGHLILTEGNMIDFAVIREDIKALAGDVALQEIDYDPHQATHLVSELMEAGLELVEVPQTIKHLPGPFQAVLDLLKAGKLFHDGNPCMTWNVANVVTRPRKDDDKLFPRKAARHLKIDGFTALLDALSRALVQQPADTSAPMVTVFG